MNRIEEHVDDHVPVVGSKVGEGISFHTSRAQRRMVLFQRALLGCPEGRQQVGQVVGGEVSTGAVEINQQCAFPRRGRAKKLRQVAIALRKRDVMELRNTRGQVRFPQARQARKRRDDEFTQVGRQFAAKARIEIGPLALAAGYVPRVVCRIAKPGPHHEHVAGAERGVLPPRRVKFRQRCHNPAENGVGRHVRGRIVFEEQKGAAWYRIVLGGEAARQHGERA